MKTLLTTEEAAKLILCYLGSLYLDFSWWVFFTWLFVPDLSMAGYLFNSKAGAVLYNLAHHQGIAIVVGVVGVVLASQELQLAGLVLFGHSAMDRIFGFGLKYSDSFNHTHLGLIGK